MTDVRDASLARARFLTTLLASFAIVGLVLSIVGVYGLLAQLARNRTREMGIRLALGSPQSRVRWLVVRRGLGVTAAGLFIGGGGRAPGDARDEQALFQTPANDPATIVGVALLLAATSAWRRGFPRCGRARRPGERAKSAD